MIKVSASNLLLAWGRGVRIGKEKQLEVASNGKRYRWGWWKNTIVSRRFKIDLHPASFFIKLLRSRHSNFWDVTKVQALVFVLVITEFQAELDFYWLIIIDLTGSRWRWKKKSFVGFGYFVDWHSHCICSWGHCLMKWTCLCCFGFSSECHRYWRIDSTYKSKEACW